MKQHREIRRPLRPRSMWSLERLNAAMNDPGYCGMLEVRMSKGRTLAWCLDWLVYDSSAAEFLTDCDPGDET